MAGKHDTFGARSTLPLEGRAPAAYYRLARLEESGVATMARLPYSIRVLLEGLLRTEDGFAVTAEHIERLARWGQGPPTEVPFKPARVLLQDFTGVPSLVDLAAMRSAMQRLGGDPARIQPVVPVDLVIDHSVQVDVFGTPEALARNAAIEFERNRGRYEFLHWGKNAFHGLRVVPPATGIVHQVNLEYLGTVVTEREGVAFPDSLVGTDSHTPMINGLGIVGWGVGGIEAEAAMLGEPVSIIAPEVIGFELTGELPEGTTATDLVLTITELLRKKGVVDKFVEFSGPGLDAMSVPDRATVSNMSPENGATVTYFPIDERTLEYLRLTGRPEAQVGLVEAYARAQGLFRTSDAPVPQFTDILRLDLGTVESSLAGPKRPQDRVSLRDLPFAFEKSLSLPTAQRGFGITPTERHRQTKITKDGRPFHLQHGSVVIAAITSCTNTSNPSVMLAAGLLARKAVSLGLEVKPYVKTSLAPGSRVVTSYLEQAGLLRDLETLGFHLVGYGCTTCIGNSGPLAPGVAEAVKGADLVATAVLSGNRNFEGRIHPLVRASYLASPPLVVALALAGTVDFDFSEEPLGRGKDGDGIFLRDIWPSAAEIRAAMSAVTPGQFRERYADVFEGNPTWQAIPGTRELLYPWDPQSTYIREPPFFRTLKLDAPPVEDIHGARCLVLVGDSVTTDHVSPAGAIEPDGPAARYLREHGVAVEDFNTYGARRGNDEVLVRGTFANVRLKNRLVEGTEGGLTMHLPSGERMAIYDAAMRYRQEDVPLILLAGKEYGSGSSRDWAAKGPLLLGVRAAIAESYERIHRSNLIGMGILPLEFEPGQSASSLGLTGREIFHIGGLSALRPMQRVTVRAVGEDGKERTFTAIVRIHSEVEAEYYRHGGILHAVLRRTLKTPAA